MEQWQGQVFQGGFPFGPVGASQGGEQQGFGGGMSLGPFPGMVGVMDGVGAHDVGGMLGGVLGSGMLGGGSMPGGGALGGIVPGSLPAGFAGGMPGLPGIGHVDGALGSLARIDRLGGVGGIGMSGTGGMGSMEGTGSFHSMPGLGGLPGVPPCISPGFVAALGSLPHLGGLGGKAALSGLPGMMNQLSGQDSTLTSSSGPTRTRDDRDKGVTNDELSGEVHDFVDKWNLEQRFQARLIEQLRKRGSTWQEDLSSLGKTLQEARSPPALLSVKLREMEEGTWEPNRSRFSHGAAGGGGGGGGGGNRGSGGGSAPEWMVGEIRDFCDKFSLDDRLQHRLTDAMRLRERTFKDDMKSLSEVLATARNPPGLLSVKLREMEDGSFMAKGGGRGGNSAVGLDGVAGPRGGISADRKRELFGSLSPPPQKRRQRSESRERRRRGRSRSRRRGSRSRSQRRGRDRRERDKEKDHQERKDRRKDSTHEKVREEGPE